MGDQHEVIATGLTSTGQAQKGKDIYYRCLVCAGLVFSRTRDNAECSCGNVVIDVDYIRLHVKDLTKFEVIRKMP